MKKRLFAMMLLAVLMLCGCGKKSSVDKMTIQLAELSQDAQEIVYLLGNDSMFFDYRVDKTIKSARYDFWKYEGGEWVSFGQVEGNLDGKTGRIGVRMNDQGYDLFTIQEESHEEIHYALEEDFAEAPAVLGSRLTEPTAIKAGEELELWSKIGVSINTAMPAFSNFRTAECDSGVAITVTFSTETVE